MRSPALLAAVFLLVPVAVAATRDLDPSFGGDGKVTTDVGEADFAEDAAIQPDGRIVVAGWSRNEAAATSVLVVARYRPSGELDRTFGSGGIVRTPAAGSASGYALAIQRDGRIVVAGGGVSGAGGPRGVFVLARYTGDGSLDRSFEGDGIVFTDFGFGASAAGVAIQPDGRIVAVGGAPTAASSDSREFAVARYNPDGSLDRSFDGDGRVITRFTALADSAVAAAVQPDGKIVVGGYAGYSFSLPNTPQRPEHALVRYNADGSLDASFDGDGRTTSPGTCADSQPCFTDDLRLQPDGKILLAGGQVVRYGRDGSLDAAFGRAGKASPDVHAHTVLLQSDGRILAAGAATPGSRPRGDFAVARLLPNGRRDLRFGTSGRAVADVGEGTDDVALSAVLQRDRRIVLAGTAEVQGSQGRLFDVALVRFVNPGAPGCAVPRVRGMPLRAARTSIARARCKVGKVSRKASARAKQGRVVAQTPRAGTTLPAGGRVHLVVGTGP